MHKLNISPDLNLGNKNVPNFPFFLPNFPHLYRHFLIFTSSASFFPHFFFVFLIFFVFSSFFFFIFLIVFFFFSLFPHIIFSSQFSSIFPNIFPHFQIFSPDPDPRIRHFLQLCCIFIISYRSRLDIHVHVSFHIK